MLYLCVYKRDPGYSNGEVRIGLYEAELEVDAITKMAKDIAYEGDKGSMSFKNVYDHIKASPVNGESIQIMDLPTDYDDD
jgi:hypothetical protein